MCFIGTFEVTLQYKICIQMCTAFLQFDCMKNVTVIFLPGCFLETRESYQKVAFIKFGVPRVCAWCIVIKQGCPVFSLSWS